MMPKHSFRPATLAIHAGEERHGRNAPLTTEIAQTAVFALSGVEEMKRYAAGKSTAFFYSRYGNPTVRAAEQKIAALEGAEDAVVTSSGMAAETAAVLALCSAGDEVVSMLDIYGGTAKLFERVLPRFGIKVKMVAHQDLGKIGKFLSRRTRVLFLESPTNPTLRCVDLRALAKAGKKAGACVMVDNTFATPILQRPLELDADLSLHSATKYLGGHSDVTAGAVAGARRWIDPIRALVIQTGGVLDPGAAYLLLRGMKTLAIRVEKACRNALQVAEFLREHKKVERVMYPGFADCTGHEMARRQMSNFGMMVSFDIRGGGRAAERFIDALELWYLAPSLGGVESTVSYPVLSSHIGLTSKQLKLLDVSPATVRLSLGIEDAGDLVADLERALDRA